MNYCFQIKIPNFFKKASEETHNKVNQYNKHYNQDNYHDKTLDISFHCFMPYLSTSSSDGFPQPGEAVNAHQHPDEGDQAVGTINSKRVLSFFSVMRCSHFSLFSPSLLIRLSGSSSIHGQKTKESRTVPAAPDSWIIMYSRIRYSFKRRHWRRTELGL